MNDLILPIIAATGTWAVLVALFVMRARNKKKQALTWSERKKTRFPIGGVDDATR